MVRRLRQPAGADPLAVPLAHGFATGHHPRVVHAGAGPGGRHPIRPPWVLLAMSLAFTMTMIDTTIVSVALPTIQRDLGLTNTGRVWIVNAYLLVYTVSIAAAGKFADRFGQRRVFTAGLIVFTGASLFAGLSRAGHVLIAARALAGLGGALMTPTSQAIVTNTFPERQRGRALGVYAGVSALGVAVGPLIGGLLTTFAGWQWIFFVNLPVGVAAFVITRHGNPAQSRNPQAVPLDRPGLVLLVAGLSTLVIAVMESTEWGLLSAAFLGLLAASAVLIAAFLWLQLHKRYPLLTLRIFTDRDFLSDNLTTFLVRYGLFSMSLYAPIFVQDVLGFSAFEAGAATLPATVMLIVVTPRSGRRYDRIGARPLLVAGSLVSAAGFVWLSFALPQRSYLWLIPAYVIAGIGIGLITTPALTDAMNVAPATARGEAAGLLGTVQQLGGTIGTTVTTVLVTGLFATRLTERTGLSSPEARTALARTQGGTIPSSVPPSVIAAAKDAFAVSLAVAFLVVAALMVVSLLVGLLLHSRNTPATPSSPARVAG